MDANIYLARLKFILLWLISIRRVACFEINNGNPIQATARFDTAFTGSDCKFPDQLVTHVTTSNVTYLLPKHLDVRLHKHHGVSSSFPSWLASHLSQESHSIHSRSLSQHHARYSSYDGDVHISIKCTQKSSNLHSIDFIGIIIYHSHTFLLRPYDTLNIPRHGTFRVEIYELHRNVKQQENSKSIKALHPTTGVLSRRRRRTVMDTIDVMTFTIDVLVVVDYSVYIKWHSRFSDTSEAERSQKVKAEIKRYYKYVVDGIDSRYRNIDFADFSIQIQLVDVVIIDKRYSARNSTESYESQVIAYGQKYSFDPNEQFLLRNNDTDDKVNADEALKTFRNWTNDTRELPNFDHALLFVGYDLYTNVSDDNRTVTHTSGLAYIGTMCQPGNSLSIVEEQGGFQSIGTAAHELGHSLGALHDGELNPCRSEDRFIMAASGFGPVPEDKQPNPWQFSNCSVDYFRNFIATRLAEGEPCLKHSGSTSLSVTPMPDDSDSSDVQPPPPTSTSELPGQHYDPDEQCRLIWGPNSYLCRGAEFGDPASLCTAMYCRDPATANDCVLHTAAAGTSCGNKKWCVSGECKFDEIAPIKSNTCVLGDQPGKAFNGLTCAELVEQRPSYCYQEKVRARCCLSCDMKRSSKKGCEYGDRTQGCQPWHCGHAGQINTILSDCCRTCVTEDIQITTKSIINRPDDITDNVTQLAVSSGCHDNGVINGLACHRYVQLYGAFICYDRSARDVHCCSTCAKVRSRNHDCEFGDRTPNLCAKIANLTTIDCSNYGHQCCQTCYTEPVSISCSYMCRINIVLFSLFYLLKLTGIVTTR